MGLTASERVRLAVVSLQAARRLSDGARPLGEALPASIGHFRTSPCPCVNQKYGELGVEVPLRPNNKVGGPTGT